MLWSDGTVVFETRGPGHSDEDGSLRMKSPWWHAGAGESLTIEGRRLDADAPPLTASIPDGYQGSSFQATGLIFPMEGCWEVKGRAGPDSLTFVTRVVRR
jgi:hypothetical protein